MDSHDFPLSEAERGNSGAAPLPHNYRWQNPPQAIRDYPVGLQVTVQLLEADNDAPTVATPIPDQSATVGAAFIYAFPADTFNDADSDDLTYTATLGDDTALPTWLDFAADTRIFSGTPTTAGTLVVKVTASDGNGGVVNDEFDIVVSRAAGACAAPTGRRTIWTGEVTVGTITAGVGTAAHGFDSTASPAVGALNDTGFTVGANAYTIDSAFVVAAGLTDGDLTFSLTSSLTTTEVAALRLHVCDTPYNFSDASHGSTAHSYQWSLDLDWSGDSTHTLHLSLPENTAAVGQELTAATGTIADADGVPASFEYQWVREDSDGSNPVDIAGETSSTYTLAAADEGKRVKVKVSFTDLLGSAESRTSDAYLVTAAGGCPAPTGRRTVWTGTLMPGSSSNHHGYNSEVVGSIPVFGSLSSPTTFDIGSVTYEILSLRHVGTSLVTRTRPHLSSELVAALRLHVCDTDFNFADSTAASFGARLWNNSGQDFSDGNERTIHLSLPENTAATGKPAISGTATVGHTLTAANGDIADDDGLPTTFEYQWIREDTDGSNTEDITGETASTYTLTADDVGKKVKVKVSFTDLLGGDESLTSDAWPETGSVAGGPAITIEANRTRAAAWIHEVTYTLTRAGDTADALTVTVAFTGPTGHDWSLTSGARREVEFAAGNATATLTRQLRTGFFGMGLSEHATVSGTLTASVESVTGYDTSDTAEVQVTVPPAGEAQFVARYTMNSYDVEEGGGDYTVTIEATARSTEIDVPNRDLVFAPVTEGGRSNAYEPGPGEQ